MIYTVTLNPSIDYIIETDKFKIGEVNRANKEELYPGGKGINVSLMLNELQVENTALGFLGGFIGELTSGVAGLSWLNYGQSFGFSNPIVLNLGILVITFGLTIKITIASIVGVVLAIIIYRLL